jgi:hypothetical protein
VRKVIIPLLPFVVVVPDVREREPETPLEPALAERTLKAPLDVARPYPVIMETDPPVCEVLSPPTNAIRPPAVNLPLPTTMLTLPAAPLVADPLRRVICPLLPFVVTPEVKDKELDVPFAPALALRTLKAPLEFTRP